LLVQATADPLDLRIPIAIRNVGGDLRLGRKPIVELEPGYKAARFGPIVGRRLDAQPTPRVMLGITLWIRGVVCSGALWRDAVGPGSIVIRSCHTASKVFDAPHATLSRRR
jgi:hypothetical protein